MKPILHSIRILLFFTLLTGVVYPLFITGLAQTFLPDPANGSLIRRDGKVVGSEWLGQSFVDKRYFSSRPSSTGYNALPSGGSNFGLTNEKLRQGVDSLKQQWIVRNGIDPEAALPSEMLFSSGSGLDPHISPAAALMQINRIAVARNFDAAQKLQLRSLVLSAVEPPQFHLLGESRVNVLKINLELDKLDAKSAPTNNRSKN
ncbi:MAG: potassium-transporting ATPase subunit KdpC [Marinilabiliales bacterium]|nr:potassium-transporting ATPase subunit KdpC [Marinilabiliales bacterium]